MSSSPCVLCTQEGRLRPAPIGGEELVVCDVCWQLNDGHAIEAELAAGVLPEPLSIYDPTSADRAIAVSWDDEAGALDGLLLRSGVRWQLLRWIPRAIRVQMAQWVSTREPQPDTRAAWEGAEVWLAEVRLHILCQPWRQRRKRTYERVAAAYALSCPYGRRPLTRVTQEQAAAQVGITDRHVRNVLKWFRQRGLLAEVMPGCCLPMLAVPEDETSEEAAERAVREAEAREARQAHQTAEDARRAAGRAHARAELDALRTGQPIPAAPTEVEPFRAPREDQDDTEQRPLLHIAAVYELRLPVDPAELPQHHPLAGPAKAAQDDADGRSEPPCANGADDVADGSCDASAGFSSTGSDFAEQRFFLPSVSLPLGENPIDAGHVEKGRASRGIDKEEFGQTEGRKVKVDHRSRAQKAAQALLRPPVDGVPDNGVCLPPRARGGVSERWLVREIRDLVAAGWTADELYWHVVTGGGVYQQLPREIANPRGWIRASLRKAVAGVRPAVKFAADLVEEENADHAERRAERMRRSDAERGLARRAAVDACELCDEHGWLDIDDEEIGAVRCSHDPDTGGW